MDTEFENKIALLTERETAYTADAYHFVAEAVNYTVGKLPAHRHVTALELLKGAREMAINLYGAVAHEVLRSFGIKTASDVGKIVYLLISVNLLSSSEDDSELISSFSFPDSSDCLFIDLVSISSSSTL